MSIPFFKKGKTRPSTARKRSASPPPAGTTPAASSSSSSSVVLPTRKAAGNLLSAGSKRTLTQRELEDAAVDAETPERDGPDVKWRAEHSHVNAALDILAGDEAEELLAKRRRHEAGPEEAAPDDGLYRGQKAYHAHLQKSSEVPKARRVGPQRSTGSTIRTVTIIDYQPDVCKDYKETGYCGFGDTCKFLHDRGTYLAGWQLDKLADEAKRAPGDAAESDSDSDDEDVPFACLICRKHYTDPVVTRCGHYFCAACAIKRFAKTPKCVACGAPTGGIFNRADKIIEKVNKKRAEKGDGEEEEDKGGGVEIEGLQAKKGDDEASDEEPSDED
ncbi:Pre-mRNA-splicing factor CWC24 [Mycena indigotica]|uniref:Pre-mRNA-splicing factor CWC24 n=1 Tax=Mycena indigotica TaxID=2126181 RepID=A0A8H6TBU2_9AGAR|nr:Pre-mRNA-splicing factor CWC24 [Mycena indigotica]KAF7315890.1 Pre-mRNA-splicing factor CWC24 [Mycena indigotica]